MRTTSLSYDVLARIDIAHFLFSIPPKAFKTRLTPVIIASARAASEADRFDRRSEVILVQACQPLLFVALPELADMTRAVVLVVVTLCCCALLVDAASAKQKKPEEIDFYAVR